MKCDLFQMAGQWVADEDMHPATNVAGRRYWAPGAALGDEIEGVYWGSWPTHSGMKPQGLYWFFPPAEGSK